MGTYLTVQWLTLCPSNAWGTGSIPGWETKIPHAAQPTQLSPPPLKKKKKFQLRCINSLLLNSLVVLRVLGRVQAERVKDSAARARGL